MAHHYITMNFPRVPPFLPGISFGDVDNYDWRDFSRKRWGQGRGEGSSGSKNLCSSLKRRLDVFLVIYKLTTAGPRAAPTPRAAGIIVWQRPGRAICSARRAAPFPPQAQVGAVPNAHPPSLLCMRQHRRLPGCRRGRKTQESEPRALPGSQPRTRRRESQEGHRKPALGQQKAHAWPPSFSAHHRVRFSLPFPHHPGTSCPFSILLLSLRLQAETRFF